MNSSENSGFRFGITAYVLIGLQGCLIIAAVVAGPTSPEMLGRMIGQALLATAAGALLGWLGHRTAPDSKIVSAGLFALGFIGANAMNLLGPSLQRSDLPALLAEWDRHSKDASATAKSPDDYAGVLRASALDLELLTARANGDDARFLQAISHAFQGLADTCEEFVRAFAVVGSDNEKNEYATRRDVQRLVEHTEQALAAARKYAAAVSAMPAGLERQVAAEHLTQHGGVSYPLTAKRLGDDFRDGVTRKGDLAQTVHVAELLRDRAKLLEREYGNWHFDAKRQLIIFDETAALREFESIAKQLQADVAQMKKPPPSQK